MGYFLLLLALVGSTLSQENQVPRLDLVRPDSTYHGLVREDELLVDVTPTIRAVGTQICGFRIVNRHHGDAPFEIFLKDQESGEAGVNAKKPLNCEKRKNYKFDIAAVSCSGLLSDNATVHISVTDVNEYAPTFLEPSYVVAVDEGRYYQNLLQVEAVDEDCSPKFGDICKYEILTSDQPFTVDNDGVIRNTEQLNYELSHNHILSVVAYDCGMRRSQPVMVNIKVNRICKLGWKGIPERVDYAPGSSKQDIFPDASLNLCDVPCNLEKVQVKVNLETFHIGKGCDRDTYSVPSQRKLCGASPSSIDLLPIPGLGAEWTKSIPTDDGHESDQIYRFDGATNAAVVPESVLPHNLSEVMTLSVWVKHKPDPTQDRHIKEHIICNADDHKMNRHHFSVFIRNCRLIMLLRKEFSGGDLNTFRPAEWRWKLPQVCDNEWHHYAINVEFPDVQLYVDGRVFHGGDDNPEVIDDWPLHPAKDLNTTMTIGACWQGSENHMKHYFHGYLAGLSILLGHKEKDEVLACLHKCKESLEIPAMELLEPGMELLTNNELTELTIEGDNKTNLETLLRKVSYVNYREFPTPGRRSVKLATIVMCDNGKTVKVPSYSSYIMVLQPQQPTIEINGTNNFARDYEDFRMGVRIFNDVRVSITSDKDQQEWKNGEPVSVIQNKLDSCTMSVYPPLNPDHETVTLPENFLSELGIVGKVNKDGVIITGADMIYNYERVLRQIHYTNRKPAYYLNRAFKLVCSELSGRFVSNEYVQTLTVIHPESPQKVDLAQEATNHVDTGNPAHAQVDHHQVAFKPAQTMNDVYLTPNIMESSQAVAVSGAGHAVTIIIVVCVGFLVFMIVLGVIRIRAAHHRTQQDEIADTEMAWDDSALTITVNPMENMDAQEGQPLRDDDDDDNSSYDGSSFCDDGDSSDEEEKSKDLEWDNTTLAI